MKCDLAFLLANPEKLLLQSIILCIFYKVKKSAVLLNKSAATYLI